jgi:eukaryotic-like serine/threonine-protein kinase
VSLHPERLGKYQITGVLGEGAMGVVYRGFDPDIRRTVALKTIRRQPGESAEAAAQGAARFRNEAQAAGRLLHPGIVGVYDFGDSDDGAGLGGRVSFIAMEFVEGFTLSQYLAQKVRFSEADIASLAVQLTEALAHAHDNGVWHRDIKPSNVIMTKAGRIKIADFGIARTDTSALTMANSVLGTPMYMAPEQFMGRPIDHRVDVYGAGVVLYQLVAGRAPFMGTHEALMYKVVNEVPPPPSASEGAMAGPRFDAVVAQALAKAAQERFASALAFRDAVVQAFGGPAPTAVSREAVFGLPALANYAPTERIVSPFGAPFINQPGPGSGAGAPTQTTGAPPTHWDPAVLAQVESSLAKHVGPLAAVLVRRAAKECHDLVSLQSRLAEQITSPQAREAFLGAASKAGSVAGTAIGAAGGNTGVHSSAGTHLKAGAPSTFGQGGGTFGGAHTPINDAVLEQSVKLLSAHLGPIARVVVKRSAERTRERGPFFELLAQAAPEAVRARLLAELRAIP